MAGSNFSPEVKSKELMVFLQSSNLHYAAQVTPFSLYITVRKKFRKASTFAIPDLASSQSSEISIPNEELISLKKDHKKELKEKAQEFHNLKVSKELLEEKLCKLEDSKLDLYTELEDKLLECHELKVNNDILQEKLQKTEADFDATKIDNKTLIEKNDFLVASVMRSTEETLTMERKLTDAKKCTKKKVKEIGLLSEKIETLEHTNKMLKEENDMLQDEVKLSEAHNESNSVLRKISKAELSSFSNSSTYNSFPDTNLQAKNTRFLQASSSASYSDSRKPFPPYSEAKDFSTPFTSIETVVPEEPFSPIANVNPGKLKSSQDGNNNQADDDNNRVYDAHCPWNS